MESVIETLKKWLARIKEIWSGLNLNQKVLIAGAVLLLLTAAAVSSSAVFSTEYEPLFANLAVKDAAAMTAKLDELNIDYKLEDGGTSILVPAELKYQTRLQLAGAGLPEGVVGFEIFNETSFGETETDKRVKYQVALQGELTKTIQSIDKIEAAKVNLVIPEKSLYTEDQELATASVLIKNKPHTRMEEQEIQGIIHLVANSVEGLKPENVTVVDTNGNILSANLNEYQTRANSIELTQAQMALQRAYERDLQDSVESMLERVVGVGKAVVRVSAELDFDEKESRMEIYAPLQDKKTPATFPRSENRSEEISASTNPGAEGAPGVDTNIPTYQQANPATESSSTEKSERTINWEIDKEEIVRKFAPGAVKTLTVAVIVDQELDAAQEEDIQQMVETAVGIDRNNPDLSNRNVSVTGMKFNQIEETPPEETSIWLAIPLYAWVLLLLVILAAAAALIRMIYLRRIEEEEPQFDVVVEGEINIQDLLEKEMTPQEQERKMIRAEVEKLVDANPEDAANLVRTWLLEEGM